MSIKWEKNDSGFYPIDEFTSNSFSTSSGVYYLSVLFEVYSVSEHDESNNVRVVIGNNDQDIPFEHGGSLFYKGDVNTAKKIVENTIGYFEKTKNVISNENKYKGLNWENIILNGIADHIQSIQKELEQNNYENTWDYNEKHNLHVLTHFFRNDKTFFELDKIDHNSYILNFYQNGQEKSESDAYRDENPKHFIDGDKYCQAFIEGDINFVKKVVENAVGHFDKTINYGYDLLVVNENIKHVIKDFENYENELRSSLPKDENINAQTQETPAVTITEPQNQQQSETANKIGYIQGVCECVIALGDNTLGKKLLSEMQVTKDMAKKFANPETYKVLEEGIFAQKPEQKLEQTQGVKR